MQYTRNMVTGASTADLSIVLVDARAGVVEQSKRHAYIASLLRIPHLVVAVNKMDLVDFDEAVFDDIRDDFTEFAADLDFAEITFIPVSALDGDNVVDRSERMPWYDGPLAAGAPGDGRDRQRPQPRGAALPGAVGDPAAVRRAPRLPRLRRPAGLRAC